LQEGIEFLEKNKKRDEVICLESGLQYEILQAGEGPKPTASDTVTCHYHGTLIDGRVFDSSVQRGTPASFPLNRVIAGWTEAVQLMPVGSKWRLYLPPHLAYGDRQMGALIQPNSSLIFEVELLGF
jgi:FKBP-type peptidyl-prolyl cis-trans isomerase FklB